LKKEIRVSKKEKKKKKKKYLKKKKKKKKKKKTVVYILCSNWKRFLNYSADESKQFFQISKQAQAK